MTSVNKKVSENNANNENDEFEEENSSPVVLEMELPPPSDTEGVGENTERVVEKLSKKVNRLNAQLNVILYVVFITPFWLLALWRHGHLLGHYLWLLTTLIYSPVLIYLLIRLCVSFCVTKPLSPAELAYLQENED